MNTIRAGVASETGHRVLASAYGGQTSAVVTATGSGRTTRSLTGQGAGNAATAYTDSDLRGGTTSHYRVAGGLAWMFG